MKKVSNYRFNQEFNGYPTVLACYLWNLQTKFAHAPRHFLELDDSPRIHRACSCKDIHVPDLQAHARLAQNDKH